MKIAITSQGETLDSKIDSRFGRAGYILVVDPETLDFKVFDNQKNKDAFKGAGIQAAAMISDSGARVLLTGFCGPNAFKTLSASGIKVVNDQSGTIMDAVERFRTGQFCYAQSSNKEGHW